MSPRENKNSVDRSKTTWKFFIDVNNLVNPWRVLKASTSHPFPLKLFFLPPRFLWLSSHSFFDFTKFLFNFSELQKDEVYLNLVLEYIPETVYKVARQYAKNKQTIPINFIRVSWTGKVHLNVPQLIRNSIKFQLYMYQLFRSLAYIHSLGICHRDIKPQNLLLDPETAVLKLCDFGSAKQLLQGEPNVSYICSRYYRAPELIFGAINYTTRIGKNYFLWWFWRQLVDLRCFVDVWSAGCVLAELLLGQPIFPGDSGVDQLVEIIKVLGTPTRDQIKEMNPNYTEFKFPQIKSHPWQKVSVVTAEWGRKFLRATLTNFCCWLFFVFW